MKINAKFWLLLLAWSALVSLPFEAAAAENREYVLIYDSGEGRPYWFASPFTVRHTIHKEDGSVYYSGDCAPQVFRLESPGNGPAISAYCADPAVGLRAGVKYRRLNLEDSDYFSDSTAGRLRSIIRSAYPQVEVETLQEKANDWLRQRELPLICQLQTGEAILAAQIAVWKLSAGSSYTVHSLYSGTMDLSGCADLVTSQKELEQIPSGYTPENIESLYTYFCNMEPEKGQRILISDAAITRTVYTSQQQSDGKYTTQVQVTISADIGEADSLTLTVACAEQIQKLPIEKPGEYHVCFTGLSGQSEVTLSITGEQYGADAYLFDAAGERGSSQTLIGYHRGMLPVSCSRTIIPLHAN